MAQPRSTLRPCTECFETKQDSFFEQCGRSKKTEIPYFYKYCKQCKINLNRVRRRLHKEHPIRPEACECCGRVGPVHLDHDWFSPTSHFRGFLCRQCNISIGGLNFNTASDKQGLLRAVAYLERSE